MEWQNRITQVQKQMNVLRAVQTQTVVELDALLPSILDEAFRGEL